MHSFMCHLCVMVSLLAPLSVTAGQEANTELESHYAVPGGGTLAYFWHGRKVGAEIASIRYSGPPEWIVNQKDPRSHWHKIPTLKEVELHMTTTVTSEEMAYIASLKTVSSLRISETVFRGHALAPLERMTSLKSLSLDFGSHLSRLESRTHDLTPYEYPRGDFFKFLDKLESLEALVLRPECDEQTYGRICGLKNLKWLTLGEISKISDNNAGAISNLSGLEYMSFQRLEDPTLFLNGLRDHPSLRELWIDGTTLDTMDVECIASIKKLKKLHARGGRIGSLSALGANTNLTMLRLYFEEVEASDGCRFLASLQNLEELVLSGIGTGRLSLESLRGHKKLKEIGIDTVLRDEDIAILESMPELKVLAVGNAVNSEWYNTAKSRLPTVTIKAARVE
jgi:hypothetical protein